MPSNYSKKQESAQSKRGGMKPSGKKWYLSGPSDRLNSDGMPTKSGGFRYLYTAAAGSERKGSVPAPKGRATQAAAGRSQAASAMSGSRGRSQMAAKKAANPGPRIAKRSAGRAEPKRSMIKKK